MTQLTKDVKRLRQLAGESQQAFATRLGLSIRAIANYESGRRPDVVSLARLARASRDLGHEQFGEVFLREIERELDQLCTVRLR